VFVERMAVEIEGEGEPVHPEGEGRDRDEGEEHFGEPSVETERASGDVEGERIRKGRSAQSQRGPEEAGA